MRRPLAHARPCLLAAAALTGLAAGPAPVTAGGEHKPSLPPVEAALTIDRAQIPIGYPRLTADVHYGFTTIDATSMARSIDDAIGAFGVESVTDLPGSTSGVGFALGLRASYRLALGMEAEVEAGSEALKTLYFGGLATWALTSERNRSCSLALGMGLGRQRISTRKQFHLLLAPDRLLEQVYYESDWKSVASIAAVLEVPNHRYSRYALVSTVRLLPHTAVTESIAVTFDEDTSFPFEVTFGGWIMTIGLRVGL